MTSVEALFRSRLRQMLHVESRIADEVLPRLCREAHSRDLQHAFERHLADTEGHVESLEELLSELGVRAGPEQSLPLQAIMAEHDRPLEGVDAGDAVTSDLVHAMAAVATEYLEMSSYGPLSTIAVALGEESAAGRLWEILEQEELALELVERAVTKLLAEEVENLG